MRVNSLALSGNEFRPIENNTGRITFYILSGFYQVSVAAFFFSLYFGNMFQTLIEVCKEYKSIPTFVLNSWPFREAHYE